MTGVVFFILGRVLYFWIVFIFWDYVNNNDQFTGKTAVPQNKLLDLVNLVLITTWHTFNSQFYQQNDGAAM